MPGIVLLFPLTVAAGSTPVAAGPGDGISGTELYQRCAEKNPGDDQQGRFTVILRDPQGRVRRSEYLRFWKDYDGQDDIADKMLLFTVFPPDARGAAFMRIAYTAASERPVDQWIYLPLLKKIRRVTIRNPADRFLNSELTYADVTERGIDEDTHRYLGVRTVQDIDFHVVESIPREEDPLYGKRVFWFTKTDVPEECVTARIDYYDTSGDLLKDQFIKWQRIGDAWMWEQVLVRNSRSGSASIFRLSNMQVDIGLPDDLFSARSLQRGSEILERFQSQPQEPDSSDEQ